MEYVFFFLIPVFLKSAYKIILVEKSDPAPVA